MLSGDEIMIGIRGMLLNFSVLPIDTCSDSE